MDIVKKINGVMSDVVANNSEWCSDHLLIIMNEILHLAAELKKRLPGSEIPQQVFDQLLVNFASFSKLLTASDIVSDLTYITFIVYCGRCIIQHAGIHPLQHDLRHQQERSPNDLRFTDGIDPTSLQARKANHRQEPSEVPLLGPDPRQE